MPKRLERKLTARANRMGLKGKRRRAYVYGTMRKSGWRPKRER
jgi:hypothetical protein